MSNKTVVEVLPEVGSVSLGRINWNLGAAALYEEAVRRGEGLVSESGPLVCLTGAHTGRSPNDKFLVKESSSQDDVWWGKVNRPITPEQFEALYADMMAHLDNKELFVQDCCAGTDSDHRLSVRIITEYAWHNLFARTMFLEQPAGTVPGDHVPEFTVIDSPSMKADPARHGTNSDVFIFVNFARKLILIGELVTRGKSKNPYLAS